MKDKTTPEYRKMEEIAQGILGRYPLWYMDMSESLKRGAMEIVYAQGNTLLLQAPNEPDFYRLAAEDYEMGLWAFRGLPVPRCVVARGRDTARMLAEHFGLETGEACCQGAYLDRDLLAWSLPGLTIGPMAEEEIPLAGEVYHGRTDYVRERAEAGELFSARMEGVFAGFIGFHDDGSTGLLEVLPPYRRRGIAQCLEKFMINFCLERGWTSYGQIYTDNDASFALQGSLGITVDREHTLSWCFAPEEA